MNSQLCNRLGFCFILIISLLPGFTSHARAADFFWLVPFNGNYQDASNWDQATVPGPLDRVLFSLLSTGYTVSFAADATNDRFFLCCDVATFDLGGFTYTVDIMTINNVTNDTGKLTIQNGVVNSLGSTSIGSGGTGRLTLTGATTTFNSGDLTSLGTGAFASTANLDVLAGATFNANGSSLRMAAVPGTQATLLVSGTGSTLNENTTAGMTIGEGGNGTLNVSSGGTVNATKLLLGRFAGSFGGMVISDATSTINMSGPITIALAGAASVDISSGGLLEQVVPNTLGVGTDGTMDLFLGGQLITRGTAILGSAVAGKSPATISVSSSGTIWSDLGEVRVGTTGPAQLTVSSGGLFDEKNPNPFIVGPNATIDVQSGGIIRSGGSVTPGGTTTIGSATGSTATVTVSGTGSTWETFGPTNIGVSGPASLIVSSGGLVEGKDPDPYIVGPDGLLSLNSGGDLITRGTTTIGNGGVTSAQVIVDGVGSRWDSFGAVNVGTNGLGVLTVSNGGLMEEQNPVPLIVGPDGNVDVRSAGKITTADVTVGAAGVGEAVITVSDAGSRWDISGTTSIGEAGRAKVFVNTGGIMDSTDPSGWIVGPDGDVNISTGGSLLTHGPVDIGTSAVGTATMTVTGTGARWDAFDVVNVGTGVGAGAITVDSGGVMELREPMIGTVCNNDSDNAGSLCTVDAECPGGLCIMVPSGASSVFGAKGLTEVLPGGTMITSGPIVVGNAAGATATVVVNGASANWTMFNGTSFGESGPANLSIGNGGLVDYDATNPLNIGPDATIDVTAGGSWWTGGTTNIGTAYGGSSYISPARVTVSGAGASWDNFETLNVGESGLAHITIANGGVMTDFSPTSTSVGLDGQVFGSGTMAGDYLNSGRFHPGASPGVLTVTGNYTQSSDGQLILEIDGDLPGSFDQINISFVATLDGRLVIDRDFLFVPSLGDTFTVMTYGARVGTFAEVDSSSFGSGLAFQLNYNAMDLTLQVVADCNYNSIPDSEDISNCAGDPDCSDCNGNGIPDACDIDLCDRANDPTCDDCNGNGVPDSCDIFAV